MMVKKILPPLFVLGLLVGLGYIRSFRNTAQNALQTTVKQISPYPSQSPLTRTRFSIFVPYWISEMERDKAYDSYYYFGIEPTRDGFVKDPYEKKREELMRNIPPAKRQIVLRMLDQDLNAAILKDTQVQRNLSKELNVFLDENEYQGVLIDLEVSFTLREQTQNEITQFVHNLCTGIKDNYKSCSMLIYGDLSYRKRPYNLKELGRIVDTIYIMTYDFHKAGGEPGPNFPLSRRSVTGGGSEVDYGYDFKQMVSDFVALVPREKLEVVFGMYGYDWVLNEQGSPLKTATAISLNEIEHTLGRRYPVKKNDALEKSIEYIDEQGRRHIVWYEDEESVQVKTEYLLKQGVGRISFWAYSYF